MRLWSHQAVARGADGIMFFQWRASRAGAEKFHSAMVPHVDPEGSSSWREVKRLGADLGKLDALLGAAGDAETAILLDWESWWALELDSKSSTAVRMLDGLYQFYEPLFESNVPVDLLHPGADLSGYKLVIAPNLYLVRDEAAENVVEYVRRGGTLLMSFFSGIVDENEHVRLGGYPAPFRELLGLRIEDFVPLAAGEENRLLTKDGASYSCNLWADWIHAEGAEPLAFYADGFYSGTPAATRHSFGDGTAYYLGTRPEKSYTKALLGEACREVGNFPPLEAPPGVEAVRRKTGGSSFLFLLNHNEEVVELTPERPSTDLLTGEKRGGTLDLEPLGVAIIEESIR